MHALDRLIQLARVQGVLDLRCLLSGPLEIDHQAEPEGVAAYHVVLAGQCQLQRPGTTDLKLTGGDILLLPRGQAHVIRIASAALRPRAPESHFNGAVQVRSNVASGAAELDLLCGRFAYAYPSALIDVLPDVVLVRSNDPDLKLLVSILRRETETAMPGAQSIVGAVSGALFAMVVRHWLNETPGVTEILAVLSHPRVGLAVTAMLLAPGEPWTIALLAQRAAMSRASFMRAYASLSTQTPMEALGRIRMQQAGYLLTHSNDKIGDIAAAVGYTSETAFAKKFSETLKATPRQFRAAHRS